MLALVDDRGVERKMVLAVSVWAALAAEEQAPRCRPRKIKQHVIKGQPKL